MHISLWCFSRVACSILLALLYLSSAPVSPVMVRQRRNITLVSLISIMLGFYRLSYANRTLSWSMEPAPCLAIGAVTKIGRCRCWKISDEDAQGEKSMQPCETSLHTLTDASSWHTTSCGPNARSTPHVHVLGWSEWQAQRHVMHVGLLAVPRCQAQVP